MKRVIGGKLFDTVTAERVADVSPRIYSRDDFEYEDTVLYRTKKGAFFLAGSGGARSRWAQRVNNGSVGGSGMLPIDLAEAKSLVEEHGEVALYARLFGEPEEA